MTALAEQIRRGDLGALARAATLVENRDARAEALLSELSADAGRATVLGVTGPPGCGKSTLVDGIAAAYRQRGRTVGIVAVDPTSPITGGAILGDRVRMQRHHADPGVFIRSMAARGWLGGIGRATAGLALLLDAAGFNVVIVETVGVGQGEVEVARMADVTIVVLVPGLGDDVQAIKAGIMEIADVFVINKSDLPGAQQLAREIRGSGALAPIVHTVAHAGRGVEELIGAIDARAARRNGRSEFMKPTIGVIGGSGLYSMPGFEAQEERVVETPWGTPSGPYVVGTLAGRQTAFLARHGSGHRISPSELNFRANIWGFRMLGVERIVSLSAVGSLKEEHKPLEFVIPDQFYDRTKGRVSTFFGDGLVAHISFAHPICPQLAEVVARACQDAGVAAKRGGTYVCMEGPAFSTLAESNLYRSWGMDVIGMTNLQEAKLAREAGMCYVTVAMVTDYDCWHPEHDAVTVTDIVANLTRNAGNAARVVAATVASMPEDRECKCGSALAHAIITDRASIPESTRRKLDLIAGKYLA